jgi:hypothetical protein
MNAFESTQKRFFSGNNIYKSSRSAIIIQSASILEGVAVGGERGMERGWDAGVAVDDDDGG